MYTNDFIVSNTENMGFTTPTRRTRTLEPLAPFRNTRNENSFVTTIEPVAFQCNTETNTSFVTPTRNTRPLEPWAPQRSTNETTTNETSTSNDEEIDSNIQISTPSIQPYRISMMEYLPEVILTKRF